MRDSAHTTRVTGSEGTPHAYGPNLHLHGTPLALSMLARLGHPDTHQPEVGRLAARLFEYLFTEVANTELPVEIARVPTRMTAKHPDEAYDGVVLTRSQRVVVVDVARAGILSAQLFYDRFNEALDPAGVRQDHMFVGRTTGADGCVTGAAIAAAKIGGPIAGALLVIPDPMGATGGSLCHVLDHYESIGAGQPAKVVFVHLVVTPEYVQRVHAAHPDVVIHAIRLDRAFSSAAALESLPGARAAEERGLDEHQYIVPGAGGLGEVLNNSWV
ncbi:MAG: uracil phosphoribosyltransferase [Pseudomonadota bacterium]|nr:uracil phosphoribosyltransferase [Pseudomonadota bacterium]